MKNITVLLLCLTGLLNCPAIAEFSADKQQAIDSIDARRDDYAAISRQIWKWAELAFVETRSSKLLQDTLENEGFTIDSGVAGMPTAFVASYGTGKPVIGLLAEYDALPGMSQAVAAEKKPLVEGATGHGCGHNLLGTGCVAAGIAVKDWLEKTGKSGTIRVYGCPAEENGSGKKYLVAEGLFDDVDAAFTWHQGSNNGAHCFMSIGIYRMRFKFHGVSAHASLAPQSGRSALDGVESLNYMVNMMREHVDSRTRIHYIIQDGGQAENTVPAYAEVRYMIRHHDMKYLKTVVDRITKAAEGAALGTGTTVETEISLACVPTTFSRTLSEATHANLKNLKPMKYSQDEIDFVKKFNPNYPPGHESQFSAVSYGSKLLGGTDVGFVSWATPTVHVSGLTTPLGTASGAHTWRAVVFNGCGIGEQGMIMAAKIMTAGMIDIYEDPSLAEKAREELIKTRGTDEKYRPEVSAPPDIDLYSDCINKQF